MITNHINHDRQPSALVLPCLTFQKFQPRHAYSHPEGCDKYLTMAGLLPILFLMGTHLVNQLERKSTLQSLKKGGAGPSTNLRYILPLPPPRQWETKGSKRVDYNRGGVSEDVRRDPSCALGRGARNEKDELSKTIDHQVAVVGPP